MSVRRTLIFNGILSSSSINQSDIFTQGDVILLVVNGLASDEFVDIAGSLNVRVKQSATLDPCDDPIPIPSFTQGSIALPGTREIFDIGDYEYPLRIPYFNSYTLAQIDREISECNFEMTVTLIPSFDISCQVWVLYQEKNTKNLYKYVCANEIKRDIQYAALVSNQIAQNQALGFSVSALASVLALPTGGSSLALAAPVLSGLALASAGIAITTNPSPVALPAPSF